MRSNLLWHYMSVQSDVLQKNTSSGGLDRTKWFPKYIDILCHLQGVNREQYSTDLDIPNLEKLLVIFYIDNSNQYKFSLSDRVITKQDYREKIIQLPDQINESNSADYRIFEIKGVREPVLKKRRSRFNFRELYVLETNRWQL